MHTKMWMGILLGWVLLTLPVCGLAQQPHGHGAPAPGTRMDVREVLVQGLKVTFQIMDNAGHRKMLKEMKMAVDIEAGTTHNVTVILTDVASGQTVTDAAVSMKVVDPQGKDQVKSLKYEKSMKSFDAFFNLPLKGRYELLVLVRTGDVKRTAGLAYELQ